METFYYSPQNNTVSSSKLQNVNISKAKYYIYKLKTNENRSDNNT